MAWQRFVKSLLILVALTVSLAASAVAQYNILSARYGTERNNIDVTQRLRELARQNRTFRMGNSTFGVDPDPGVVKTLRIFAQGPRGEQRVFEYREGSTVDGSQFDSWGGGNWGDNNWNGGWGWGGNNNGSWGNNGGDSGQWQILGARYGTERNNIDVTQRLKELASRDQRFRMGNSTFGQDPDPGHIKELRIYARGYNGDTRTFTYREGSWVDGAQFTGWGGGNWGGGGWNGGWGGHGGNHNGGWNNGNNNGGWNNGNNNGNWNNGNNGNYGRLEIVSARYGYGSQTRNVTSQVRSLIDDGRINTRVGNDNLGGDPAPGQRKQLYVSYRVNGRTQSATVNEGDTLRIP